MNNTDTESPSAAAVKPRRTWHYLLGPNEFQTSGCTCCAGHNITWSEFKDRLWCFDCELDFEPEHWGVLDGPIIMEVCALMGITFERVNMELNRLERPVLFGNRIIDWPVTGSLICS